MLRPLKKIRAGSLVYVRIEVRDETAHTRPLYTPTSAPKVRLRAPTGIIIQDFTAMTAVTTGVYSFTHQTTVTSNLGVWQVEFKIQNLTNTAYTVPADIFELVPQSGTV